MISAAELIVACEKYHVLDARQLAELRPNLRSFADAKSLARNLIERGWLTPFQANQLLTGHAQDLLLGSYVLLERIGEGGMGAVFKAKNWKLERLCAVKVIRKEKLANDDSVRRFAREIEAASKLDHPNVVRAYDAAEANGACFFVMEYVSGVNLSRLIKENGPTPPALACEYIRQAALGLQHAHERGLVHRDIKPGNLLLARTSGAGVVKVLDMGLARLNGEDGDEATRLTETGDLVGTIDYMSPEQSKAAQTADVRSDLYSLGCTFYYLLVGKAPFAGGTTTEKLLKHQTERPKPIEEFRSDVPPAVTQVIYKLLAKKPEDRYQTPAELAERLRVLQADPNLWKTSAGMPVKSASDSSSNTAALSSQYWNNIVADATVTLRSGSTVPSGTRPPVQLPVMALVGAVAGLVLLGMIVIFAWPGPTPTPPKEPNAKEPPVDPVITVTGELTPHDPPDPYRAKLLKVSSPHRTHEVNLQAGTSYRVELKSDYFDTFLRVENTVGYCLATDDDGGENKSSQLTFVATESGRYRLIATTTQGTGPYTIKLTPSPALFFSNGKLANERDTFTVELQAGTRYAVDLASKEFDTFLRIEDARGDFIDEKDTGGVNKNARLFIEPPQAGKYKITATSRDGDGRGAYMLSVAEAGKAPVPIPFTGSSIKGQILPSDLPDKIRKQPCKIYSYPMTANKLYQIDLEAIAFDPYLRVEAPNGADLAADDDGGEGLFSQINFTPQRDGQYRLVATSYSTLGTGHFTLRVTALDSRLVLETKGFVGKKNPTHSVRMTAGNRYIIETNSSAFDSVATLRNAAGLEVAKDDDSGGDRNARLSYACTLTGDYAIEVSGYSTSDHGAYRLSVRELAPQKK